MSSRIVEAIRGAFVADAASMGTHWIYDPAEMAKALTSLTQPEFRDPPTPNYYSAKDFPGHYGRKGQLSPYGEQLQFVTEYVAKGAQVNGTSMSTAFLEFIQAYSGRPDSAMKAFVKNMEEGKVWPECGADDNQAHIYMKIVPVTCRYAGSKDLKEHVVDAIRVHQNNPTAVAFGVAASRILEAVLLGATSIPEALDTVQSNIQSDLSDDGDAAQAVLEAFARAKTFASEKEKTLSDILGELSNEKMKDKPESPFYNLASRSCELPGAFIGPLVLFYRSNATTPDANYFATALRENIIASGDTCSRSIFIGAVLGAAAGSLPGDWVAQVDAETKAKMDTLSQMIASLHDGAK